MISFAQVGQYDGSGEASAQFGCSIVKENYVYICDSEGGLWIIDKTDPTNPTLASYSPEIETEGEDTFELIVGLAISEDGNTLFAGGNVDGGQACFSVVDVTNKSAPEVTGALSIDQELDGGGNIAFTSFNQCVLRLSATTILCKVFNADTGQTIIVGIDNLATTTRANPIEADGGCTNVFERMDVQDERLVILEGFPADFTACLRVYDMNDPSNPVLLGTSPLLQHIGLVQEQDSLSYHRDGLTDPVFAAVIALNDDNDEFASINLLVWDTSDPANPTLQATLVTTIEQTHFVTQSAYSNNVLIVTDVFSTSVIAFDVSNPASPSQIQSEPSDSASVCFDYPYFFTTDPLVNGIMQVWLFTAGLSATSLDPDHGVDAGGTTVTIIGTGFVPGETTVTIGGTVIPADQVTVAEDGLSLTFVTPAHAAGAVDVTVTVGESTTDPLTFTYGTSSTGYIENENL